jgi:hypothetical protein
MKVLGTRSRLVLLTLLVAMLVGSGAAFATIGGSKGSAKRAAYRFATGSSIRLGSSPVTVLTGNLPDGDYVFVASVRLVGTPAPSEADAECSLSTPNAFPARVVVGAPGPDNQATLTWTDAAHVSGAVEVSCFDHDAPLGSIVDAGPVVFTAIRVGALVGGG